MNLYSAVWMPRVIETNATRYGIIGITFAMLTWLIVVGFCVVVVAVVGVEIAGGATEAERSAPARPRRGGNGDLPRPWRRPRSRDSGP